MIPYKLLIVENDATFAEYLRHLLEESVGVGQFECYTAYTLTQAVAMLVSSVPPHYDLCLVDLGMDVSTGTETLRFLLNAQVDIPFVVVTGDSSEETEKECIILGARDFIRKGVLSNTGVLKFHFVDKLLMTIQKHEEARLAAAVVGPAKAQVAALIDRLSCNVESIKQDKDKTVTKE